MLGKNPTINGQKPNEVYDLDNREHLKALGLDMNDIGEKADEYAHYPHCDWFVIEWKGSSLPKALRQVEATSKKLGQINKRVNMAIILKKRLNRYEQRFYKRRNDRVLIDLQGRPRSISVGNYSINILLLYYSEENSDTNLLKYLSKKGEA
jgi:hypothetical protein